MLTIYVIITTIKWCKSSQTVGHYLKFLFLRKPVMLGKNGVKVFDHIFLHKLTLKFLGDHSLTPCICIYSYEEKYNKIEKRQNILVNCLPNPTKTSTNYLVLEFAIYYCASKIAITCKTCRKSNENIPGVRVKSSDAFNCGVQNFK
jgi:hypothetical protein